MSFFYIKKWCLCSIAFFLYNTYCAAQVYKEMLHKPYKEKIYLIQTLYTELIALGHKDSIAQSTASNTIKTFAIQHNDKELYLEIELFTAYYTAKWKNIDAGIIALRKVIEKAEKEKIPHIKIRAIRVLANRYWEILQDYEKAFEHYLLLGNALNEVSPAEYPDMAADLEKIADAYYTFQDYNLAIYYLKKIITIPETDFNTTALASAYNTLGLCYQQLGNYATSNSYFHKIKTLKQTATKQVWIPIADGNIGQNYYLEQNYNAAIPLLLKDYLQAEKIEDYGLAAGSLISLADIYLLKKELVTSLRYIEKARYYISITHQTNRLRLLYPVMSKWYSINAQPILANKYVDSAIIAGKEYYEKYNALKLLRAQQTISNNQRKLEIAQTNLESQKKTQQRNALIVVIIFLTLAIMILYITYKRKQLAKSLKLQTAENKLLVTRQQLEIASLQLNHFAQNISEKNELINKLQKEADHTENIHAIKKLRQSTILTEDDWIKFQQLFDKVHLGFIYRLKEKYPQISPAEIRYLTLAKLQFSTKEMAAALGVSTQSIRTNWYRIRKKLDLSELLSVEELVTNI